MGYCCQTTEKIPAPANQWSQPNYKINFSEDQNKCKLPNIQERKKLIR